MDHVFSTPRIRQLLTASIIIMFSHFQLDRVDDATVLRLHAVIHYLRIATLVLGFQDFSEVFGYFFSMSVCQQLCFLHKLFDLYGPQLQRPLKKPNLCDEFVDETFQRAFRQFWSKAMMYVPTNYPGLVSLVVCQGCRGSSAQISRLHKRYGHHITVCAGRLTGSNMDKHDLFCVKFSAFGLAEACHCERAITSEHGYYVFRALRAACMDRQLSTAIPILCETCYQPCSARLHGLLTRLERIRLVHSDACIALSVQMVPSYDANWRPTLTME